MQHYTEYSKWLVREINEICQIPFECALQNTKEEQSICFITLHQANYKYIKSGKAEKLY